MRRRDSPGLRAAIVIAIVFIAPLAARADATNLLQSYLRIDTSNPPGGEAAAAGLLAAQLHREGIATRLLVSPGGRTNLYARLDGGPGARGSLVLLHHMDVVPPAPGWSAEPFSGNLVDGFLWGPGAVDDKSLGIAHLEAFLTLARAGRPLEHDVIFLAVADEETGGAEGTDWLLERHADLFDDTVGVLTEGGNNRSLRGKTAWWGVEVAQKRPLWLEVRTRGRAGHGSTADLATAPAQLIRGLARLLEREREYRVTAEARLFFESLERLAPKARRPWLERVETAIAKGTIEGKLAPGQHNLFLDTIQVTLLHAGRQVNAVPRRARAMLDIRILPDTDAERLLAEIRELLGPDVSVEVLLRAPPAAPSPTDSELFGCIEETLAPVAPVVPSFMAGVTDARFFRQRGIPAYGFSPFSIEPGDAQGVHGIDERLAARVFEQGVETMTELVVACSGGGPTVERP